MKTIAIIPARGGSKRLLNKNILPLGSMPLIGHSIKYAFEQPEIDAVYVSTDDENIKQVAIEHGASVIDRPSILSGDLEPTVSALQHVLKELNDNEIETVVLLQPTNPLRPKALFKEVFTEFKTKNHSSAFTVTRNHDKLGQILNNTFVPYNYTPGQRSQDLEPLYYENGLLYITAVNAIRQGYIMTEDAFPFVVDHLFAKVDIDTQDDFDYAEFLLEKYKEE
ncbi:acylneuraminate cytidylyltransferase family protein [Winogradskyella sp. F6397]|uniref:Acylneuraminate cytidylyltransferase family protein n=1 Tax=Winogradskyella marina TaxID=2785530 RepID=A0ABS0EKJ7_9FLAO|nr:acylneuraminate cytidylyltransferase family protein [Winogradskyella marina]MBF8150985.1 acylneuraminate cytidylyltransferase family protein [Winogradskyella marina]